jgi:hypothetical protein
VFSRCRPGKIAPEFGSILFAAEVLFLLVNGTVDYNRLANSIDQSDSQALNDLLLGIYWPYANEGR